MTTQQKTTLILGGNGKTGRRVAARLTAQGRPVRIASRSGSPRFDWEDASAWPAALRDVGALYLAYFPDLAAPGAADHIGRLTRLANESGVERVVLLSGRGEPQVLPSEEAVRTSGLAWTILRCAWFSQNFSEGHLYDAVRGGELAFPGGQVAEPFLDVEDIADVAVAALAGDQHRGQIYDLSGPRLLTFAEAMDEIGRAAGRTIRYLPITFEQYGAALAPYVPAESVSFMLDLFRHVLDGHNAHVSDGVQRALGRRARDFSDFARAAASTGVWNA
jgi:uncharacterized protein YbjT (DUF2867 family)